MFLIGLEGYILRFGLYGQMFVCVLYVGLYKVCLEL